MVTASDESYIILQNTLLTGITNLSFNYSSNQEATYLLSNKGINRKINSPQVIDCSIRKKYLGKDFLKDLTGFAGLSGQFIYGQNALDFSDAAISSYSIAMKTNQLPEININLKIFGDLSPTTNLRKATAFADNENLNLGQDSIFFNFLNKNSAIDDFSFSANFQIEPTYEIESIKSSKVKILPPVSYSTSASIEMTEQEYEDVTGLLQNENYDRQVSLSFVDLQAIENVQTIEQEYLSFTGSGLETGVYNLEFDTGFANLDTFSFSKFGLSSQNISITSRDTIKLSVSYDGYDLSLPTGSASSVSSFEHPSSVVSGIQSQVDSTIQHFKDSFFDIPKITGEDFENTVEERLLLENESFLLLEDGDRFVGNFVYSEYALTGAEYSDSGYIFNFNTGVFVQKEDFESFETGQTNQNLHFLAIDGFTIQNFETEITGQFNNQIHDLNPLIFEQDFETELQGTTSKNIYNLNEAMQIESFETEALGLTNKNLYNFN